MTLAVAPPPALLQAAPPGNAGYMYAAYALAAFVYVGYALVLVRRRARARRLLDRASNR